MIPIWFSTGMVLSILMPICLGITVVLEPVYSKESFVKDLKKYKPNMTLATTSLWLYAMNCKMLKKTNLSFLTYPITGGELVLPRVECALNSFLREHGCSAPLIKGWGMCELGSTISSDSLSYVKPGAAGYPISHVVVAAFDPVTNKEMKYNERGELRVLSPCRMKEYFRNTDETNKFFWNDENGSAWGCTGDIGYIDEDGFVYVLGRINDVFISHKKRKMYCFDVEAIILKNPSIAQCEVVGIQTDKGYDIPVAHLILEEHCDINSEAIIWQAYKSCIENLETDCVPQGYKICNSFPIKNSGKRDMEALKQDRIGFLVPQGNRLREVSF
jgi:long-chain acyl-CoA synthetase